MNRFDRRAFGKSLASASLAAGVAANAIKGSPARQPNIVFVCSDQHSYKYTGFAGHPLVQTPNLNRIASAGVVFENAYCGSPVCVPGRSSLMTGMHSSDCNSFCNSTVWDGTHPLWGKRLRDSGYYTMATGKMDLNDDFDSGFEERETSHQHRHNPDITALFRRPVGYRVGERPGVDGGLRSERHADARRTKNALEFLKNDSGRLNQPWAVYVGLTQPHPAFVALEKYYEMYPTYSIDMPNNPPGHLENLHLVMQELRHFKRLAVPIAEERIRRARAGYYGMITELDEYIGQLWNYLERTGQLQNTLFIYTSDHGESLGEHGLWQKNTLYDVANHVPLIMAGAGLPAGSVVDAPVAHVDLVRTMLEMAGAETPSTLRGRSLKPLIYNQPGDHPLFAYTECHCEGNCTGSFMVRKGDWKYIHFSWYDDLLFNLAEDPGEFNNLIDDPATQQVQRELEEILRSQVDPEEVTLRAFRTQDRMLAEMARQLSEEELYQTLKGRLGSGQARIMAKMACERYS
jgi:choline-sulfatase